MMNEEPQQFTVTIADTEKKKYLLLKRAFDILLSGVGIVVLSPLILALSIAIKLDSTGPILFKQKRVGKNKELFNIWKFRTMKVDTPKNVPTHMLNNPDEYITKVGRFLRKTSLDELPQMFLIFSGTMTIVGPRPALWNQYDLIEERDKYGANDFTPGLTGWAQVHGRDQLDIPGKAEFDGEYVEQLGFLMDLKCFLATIGVVLNAKCIAEGKDKKTYNQNEISSLNVKRDILLGIAVIVIAVAILVIIIF